MLPVEALRESTPGAERPSKRRAVVGLGVLGRRRGRHAGRAVRRRRHEVFGLGLVAALVGVMVALPLAVRPLAALIAAPLRLRGLPGELAKQNATRNPRRTSSTAAALMIGLTLVVSMGVFASSLKASFGDVISDQTNADLFVTASSAQAPGLQPVGGRARSRTCRGRAGLGQRLGAGAVRGRSSELLVGRPGHRRGRA